MGIVVGSSDPWADQVAQLYQQGMQPPPAPRAIQPAVPGMAPQPIPVNTEATATHASGPIPFDYTVDRNPEIAAANETYDREVNTPALHRRAVADVDQGMKDALTSVEVADPMGNVTPTTGVSEVEALSAAQRARLREGVEKGLVGADAVAYMNGTLKPADLAALTADVATHAPAAANDNGEKGQPHWSPGTEPGGEKKLAPTGAKAGGGGGGSVSASMKATVPGQTPEGSDFDSPYYTMSAAAAAEAQAKGEMAQAEGDAAGQQQAAIATARANIQRARDDYDQFTKAHMARLDQMNQEVAEGKIDPERWWHSQSTGSKIVYGIASFLGGLGAALSHTQDGVAGYIEGLINNDIAAQKENLLNKHKSIENERGLLAEAYHRTKNMEEAEMLAKDLAMNEAEANLKQLQVGAKGEMANAQALMLQGQFDQARKDREEKRQEYYAKLAQAMALARMRAAAKGAGGGGANLKRVQAIGKQIEQHGVLRLLKSIDETEAGISASHGEGLNAVSSRIGWDPRSGARNNLANISELEDVYTKTFGKLSKANAERVHKLMSSGSQSDVQHALRIMKQDAEGQLNSLRAQDPEAFTQYMANYAQTGGFGGGGGGDEGGEDPNVKDLPPEE